MKYILPFLFLFVTIPIFAQQFDISGQVLNQNQKALIGAHLSLQYPWGEEVKSAVSNQDGSFRFAAVEKGGYQLLVTFLGHQTTKVEVNIKDRSIQLEPILLGEGAVDLSEVEVKDKIPLAQQLGDTTQYNADAFKTMRDANAEELIEKMPGVVVEEGKVQAQGEEVKEVLVDGRPFFGNDPRAALRNLPAEVISKIQIFDQKSDQAQFSGFDDGETSKTINIITRPNMRSAQFGKLTAGYGHEEKYQMGGNASLFDGNRRTSIIAQRNNVKQQHFATDDLLGVVGWGRLRGRGGFRGGGGRGGGRGGRGGRGGGSVNDFLVQQQDGISQTHALGVNFSDKWGKKFDFSGSYFFNYADTDAEEAINRAFIEREGAGEIYEESNTSNSRNINHRLNMRMEFQIDSANSIIMRPRLSFQDNQAWSNTFGQTTLQDQLLSQTENEYRPDLRAWDFNNRFLFRHRFKKRGRTFSINLTTAFNPKNGASNLLSVNTFTANPIGIDSLDQLSSLEVNTWSIATSTYYTEPIGKNSSLLFNFRNSWRADDSEKLTSDFDTNEQTYSSLNEQLSNVFNNDYDTQELGVGYNYRKGRDFIFIARANVQRAQLVSEESFPQMDNLNRTFYSLLKGTYMRRIHNI
ncbi:MAG: carboxypeptidase-like regulatory domain-containing protein [Bacteroidota bacterium]